MPNGMDPEAFFAGLISLLEVGALLTTLVICLSHSEEMMKALHTFKGKKKMQAVVWKNDCSQYLAIPGKSSHCICCLWLLIVFEDVLNNMPTKCGCVAQKKSTSELPVPRPFQEPSCRLRSEFQSLRVVLHAHDTLVLLILLSCHQWLDLNSCS